MTNEKTSIKSGVLPALIDYYKRLEADPKQAVAGFGFSREKIHFCVVLEPDGALSGGRLSDVRETSDRGKPIPTLMTVPDGGGRQGTGLKPFFCWDNTGYALGRDNKGKPERAIQMFAAFREQHLSMRDRVGDADKGYAALCRFLEQWNPADAEALPEWEEAAGLNVVFKLRGQQDYVHQSEAVSEAWRAAVAGAEAGERGISLISGEEDELARLHPLISGVSGTNTTGAAIVSFNLAAFESYGKGQSYNAPVGARDAFRYTTALNRLLAERGRRVMIGDATVIFWSDREEASDAEALFAAVFGEEVPKPAPATEHGATVDRLRNFLEAARQGLLADEVGDPKAPFYVLGLSPNASRINVRFWLTGTVQQFVERLARHVADLEMVGGKAGDPPLVIRRLLLETAREPKDIPPQLAGEIAHSVLAGLPYRQALFSAVVRRIRIDTSLNQRRAAILKAYLVRNKKWEVPVALNKDHPDEAYHLGRLFAALEKTQEDALPGLNRTIKDSYFGAASATPASVFPRLLRLHQHHLNKIENVGGRINREKLVQDICSNVTEFPAHLPLERQGLFYIAYYHQRQAFFTKQVAADATGQTQEVSV